MNVIKLELKRLRLSTIIWTVVLIGFFLIALTEYEAFEVSGDAVNEFMKSFPPIIKSIFGMNNLDLTEFSGYYRMMLLYGMVMVAIHGLFLGIRLSSGNQQDKLSDFILTKPIKRKDLLDRNWVSGIIVITLIHLTLLVSQLEFIEQSEWVFVLQGVLVLLVIDILFYGLGFYLAQRFSQWADKIGLGLILFFYFWPVVFDLFESDLRNKSLFTFTNEFDLYVFDFKLILILLVLVLISVIFYGMSREVFKDKDMTV